jgi:Ca2+-transporting ATPase
LCHFDAGQRENLDREVAVMAAQGLRVLGIAQGRAESGELPKNPRELALEFVGLVGLADPIRPAVPRAIAECYRAGIRVVMITGDYPGTATQIAGQIGLANAQAVITGEELDRLTDEDLRERVRSVNVFARMVPEQKLRLVTALQANGEVVAMTGDGVNDAPALKAAQIGVAMGGRGTDVAREAAALVLLDDDFTSIVRAIRLGRRIYDNLQKAMAYIVAVHVPIAGIAFLPVLMKWPIILEPIHLVFLELVIDPACSIAFEAEREERNIMRRPPRDPLLPILNREQLRVSLLQGLCMMLITLAVFAFAWIGGRGAAEARTFTFAALVFANFALILTKRLRSADWMTNLRSSNKAVWWVICLASAVLMAVLYAPWLRAIFHFAPLHPVDLGAAFAAGLACFLCFEALKKLPYAHAAVS